MPSTLRLPLLKTIVLEQEPHTAAIYVKSEWKQGRNTTIPLDEDVSLNLCMLRTPRDSTCDEFSMCVATDAEFCAPIDDVNVSTMRDYLILALEYRQNCSAFGQNIVS